MISNHVFDFLNLFFSRFGGHERDDDVSGWQAGYHTGCIGKRGKEQKLRKEEEMGGCQDTMKIWMTLFSIDYFTSNRQKHLSSLNTTEQPFMLSNSLISCRLLRYMIIGALSLTANLNVGVNAFSNSYSKNAFHSQRSYLRSTSSLNGLASSGDVTTSASSLPSAAIDQTSTLTLLEHINLNVPNHDHILDFYIKVLGCGLDPRKAHNVEKGSGTIWANCGASQFHLPHGEEAQVIPGSIGLWYDDLTPLKGRLASYDDDNENTNTNTKPFAQYSFQEINGKDTVRIMDHYGNIFYCREGNEPIVSNDPNQSEEIMRTVQQPLLHKDDPAHLEEYASVAETYGISQGQTTECKGISYVEFLIKEKKAPKIAEFYDCVFDAPTTVFTDPSTEEEVAIVAFGSIDETTGRSSQSLIFRESSMELPPYDGHHIALYVGKNKDDFEHAFKNVLEAQVVWVNPRFSDKVDNVNTAKKWKQFRFKNLTDLRVGKKIHELEHEVKSAEHDSWPGK